MAEHGKLIIFFAKVSEELLPRQQILRTEFEHIGCEIRDEFDISEGGIRSEIKNCDMSVHLLYPAVQKQDENNKLDEDQICLALAECEARKESKSENDLQIYAWYQRPTGLTNEEEDNLPDYFDDIRTSDNIELLRMSFQELKSYLIKKIEALSDTQNENEIAVAEEIDKPNIYLIYDIKDRKIAEPYAEYLTSTGRNVLLPIFESDIIKVRNTHNHYLKILDVAVVLWHEANANWLNMKVLDILKAPGLGRTKPILSKVILANETKLKELPPMAKSFQVCSKDGNEMEKLNDLLREAL